MNRAGRTPLSALDHNRYLYDEMETREPSVASCSKISEIDFDRFNDIIQSNVVPPPLTNCPVLQPSQQHSENAPKKQEKKSLGMLGRHLNYKVLTEQTEEEDEDTAQKLLLVILENERLRMQANRSKSAHAQMHADLIRSESVRESLFTQVVRFQPTQQALRAEIKAKDVRLEEFYKEITWLKARNQELNNEVDNAKRWLNDYGELKASGQLALTHAQEEITQLKAKVQMLSTFECEYKMRLAEESRKRDQQLVAFQQLEIKRREETLLQWEEKSNRLEDENVSLRFEISKLKTELNMRVAKEKDWSIDIGRAEAVLKQRQAEYREELKCYQRRLEETQAERQHKEADVKTLEAQRRQLTDELRTLKESLRGRQHELEEIKKSKQIQIELRKTELKRLQQQLEMDRESKMDRIRCLQEVIEKFKQQQEAERQEHSKTLQVYKKELENAAAKISNHESEKSSSSALEISVVKLKTQNSALKEEISEQYRSILMFENKMKAYELRIQSLESHASSQQQQFQKHANLASVNTITVEDRCYRQHQSTDHSHVSHVRDTAQSTAGSLRPRSLTHHYSSSGTIRPADTDEYRRERRKCASRDRIDYLASLNAQSSSFQLLRPPARQASSISELREDPINVTLPLRRDRPQLHHRKQSLNDAIVRKCRVMNC